MAGARRSWLLRTARTVGALLRASLLTSLQYRADFLFNGVTGLVRAAATAAPLAVVYGQRADVAGWSLPEAALVMALFLVMEGLVGSFVEPNLGAVVEGVRDGSLDLILLKPADSQLLCSVRQMEPSGLWDLVAGGLLGAWALRQLPPPGADDVLIAATLVLAGLVSVYAIWLLAICLSFFFVRVDNLRFLLEAVTGAGRWPVTVFTGWVRWLLTVAVPVGVLTTFPALALTGRWSLDLVALGLGVAALFAIGSRWAWVRSVGAYTSASS